MKRLLILLGTLFILAAVSAGIGLYWFIQGDWLRDWLSRRVGRSLHVEGHLEPLTWQGLNFESAGFSGTGTGKGKLRSLKVTRISAHVDWRALLHSELVIDYLNMEKIEAVVGKAPPGAAAAKAAPQPVPDPAPGAPGPSFSNLFPSKLRVEHIYVADANLSWQTNRGDSGRLTGSRISATETQPGEWDIQADGGKVQHAAYPVIDLERANGTVNRDFIVIQHAKAATGGTTMELEGKIAIANQLNAVLTASFSDMEANLVFPPAWQFGGKISGHLTYTGDLDRFEHGEVTGSVKVSEAAIDLANVFATLRQLAKFGGLNSVQLDSVATDIWYQEGNAKFSNFHASYQDQVRVEGAGSLGPSHIDADLTLGLSPKILGWIPGAQDRVFTVQKDGLRWTSVRISGTPEQPKEDLTKRLVSAFRDKMTQEFKGESKDAIKSLLDMFHN